ncbi:hypothetical protein [Dactylosporangium sp. NPDC050588]|uniref:hypothetical protein n=1 Tax=Dactylosporangium sp. NPDC050588 TaxID=3157211 RepID=UPI0033E21D40
MELMTAFASNPGSSIFASTYWKTGQVRVATTAPFGWREGWEYTLPDGRTG